MIQAMKKVEDLGKIVKEMVDLTNSENANSNPLAGDIIKMPELALVMAKYFTSLGKYCLSFYNGYKQKEKIEKKSKKAIVQEGDRNGMPPRKPLSAYIAYYQQKVPVFQEKYQNYTISELTRLIAKQWSELPEQQKNPYIERSAIDRKRYEKQHKQYRQGRKKQETQPNDVKQQLDHNGDSQLSEQNENESASQPEQNQDEI